MFWTTSARSADSRISARPGAATACVFLAVNCAGEYIASASRAQADDAVTHLSNQAVEDIAGQVFFCEQVVERANSIRSGFDGYRWVVRLCLLVGGTPV